MSNSIQQLRERHNTLADEVRNLCEQHPGATWNSEHQKIYDARMEDIERTRGEIQRLEAVFALDAERQAQSLGIKDAGKPKDEVRVLLNKWLRGGDNALTAEDWTSVRNTMSTATDSEGGYTVSKPVVGQLIEAMKAYGGMRLVSTALQTAKGNTFSYPTNDDTGNTGEQVAENTTANNQDTAFGTVSMAVYKYSSKVITVPIELLQDSEIDIEALVTRLCGTRIGRITNTKFTTGTGTSEPRGIVTAAAAGKVGTTGQTLTVIYDDLVDLEHSIDPAYRNQPGVGFMMNDASVKVIRKIKDTTGRPIFVPGYESGSPGGAPGTLLGRPIYVNQDMAVMAANAKSILFGVLSNYMIRDVMQATLFRFTDSAYTKLGQVGFMAWARHGGNLLDVSGSTVKYYQNSAT